MKALDNRFYVKFMQLEIGLLTMIFGQKWLQNPYRSIVSAKL